METQGELVYKITAGADWEAAVATGAFAGSADDVRDGYIHLSAPDQLQATAAKYFAGIQGLVLVAVDASLLGAALRWEPSRGGALFPHYYGDLPVAAVRWMRPLPLGDGGLPRVEETINQS